MICLECMAVDCRHIVRNLIPRLSDGDIQLCRGLAEGLSNRQLAERLKVAQGTVKVYVSRIFTKLGFSEPSGGRRDLGCARVKLARWVLAHPGLFGEIPVPEIKPALVPWPLGGGKPKLPLTEKPPRHIVQ